MDQSRTHRFWLFAALLLSGTLAIIGYFVGSPLRQFFWFDIFDPPHPPVLLLAVFLAPPSVLLMVGVLAELTLNDGGPAPSTTVWDRLLREKHKGNFLQRSGRIRESARRVARLGSGADSFGQVGGIYPVYFGEDLDRLMERKRRGEWAPRGIPSSHPE